MNRERCLTKLKKSLRFLPDKTYIRLYYRFRVGKKLNMSNPSTLNEKLQWLKFHYRFPLQTVVSDKLLVRDYVKEKIGEQYLIPLLGVWDDFNDIDFSFLPEKFVLKCNHDSGGLVICENKEQLNYREIKSKIEKSLKNNFFYIGREFQYKNIKPKILCEQFISENGCIPIDYKIYCFNGMPDVTMVCKNRFYHGSHRASYSYYDRTWKYIPLNKKDTATPNELIERPINYEKMLEIAEILSSDFLFARIDLYNVSGKVYFGEITLSPNSGFDADITQQTDLMFGEKLKIPYWDKIVRTI